METVGSGVEPGVEKFPLEEQCQFAGKKAHASEGKDEMAVGFVCTKCDKFIPAFAKEFDIDVEDIKEHCEKVKQDLAKFEKKDGEKGEKREGEKPEGKPERG